MASVGVRRFEGAFDLTVAFAAIRPQDKTYGPIVRTLRALEAIASIRKDLEEARETLDAGATIAFDAVGAVSRTDLIKMEALSVHALVLYCRAVHSQSKARQRIDVLGSYTKAQLQAHKTVSAYSDGAIAHFGHGRDLPGGSWNEDHVVLWRAGGRYQFSFPSARTATKAAIGTMLSELIDAAQKRILEYLQDRQDRLMGLLHEGLQHDDELRRLVSSHAFEESDFFKWQIPLGTSLRFLKDPMPFEPG